MTMQNTTDMHYRSKPTCNYVNVVISIKNTSLLFLIDFISINYKNRKLQIQCYTIKHKLINTNFCFHNKYVRNKD